MCSTGFRLELRQSRYRCLNNSASHYDLRRSLCFRAWLYGHWTIAMNDLSDVRPIEIAVLKNDCQVHWQIEWLIFRVSLDMLRTSLHSESFVLTTFIQLKSRPYNNTALWWLYWRLASLFIKVEAGYDDVSSKRESCNISCIQSPSFRTTQLYHVNSLSIYRSMDQYV